LVLDGHLGGKALNSRRLFQRLRDTANGQDAQQ